MVDYNLLDAVIKLHDVARLIESSLGECPLSKNIRQEADRVSNLARSIQLPTQ